MTDPSESDRFTDNGMQDFGIGVGIVAAITAAAFIILQFTTDWSLIFWGLSVVGLFLMVRGMYRGLRSPDPAGTKFGRLLVYVAGIAVVGACTIWTWNTFYAPPPAPPPSADVEWTGSTNTITGDPGSGRFLITGTIRNRSADWHLEGLELLLTPVNDSGDPLRGSAPIRFDPAPSGVRPRTEVSYSQEVMLPPLAAGYEEELTWEWWKD